MNNLPAMIEHQCKGNIDKFATYVIVLLLRLTENGNTNAQHFDKVYEVLINISCSFFNSEIVLYNQVNVSNLDVSKVIIKAIVALVVWTSQDNEITKLKLELKNTKKENLALRQNGKQPNDPTKTASSRKYSWDLQWDKHKDFQLREEFLTWHYSTPLEGKSKTCRNGLLWH